MLRGAYLDRIENLKDDLTSLVRTYTDYRDLSGCPFPSLQSIEVTAVRSGGEEASPKGTTNNVSRHGETLARDVYSSYELGIRCAFTFDCLCFRGETCQVAHWLADTRINASSSE